MASIARLSEIVYPTSISKPSVVPYPARPSLIVYQAKKRCCQKDEDNQAASNVTISNTISISKKKPATATEVIITESTVRENMVKQKKAIIASMNNEKLYKLFRKYEIDDILEEPIGRRKKAQMLFENVLHEKDSLSFYDHLVKDTDHMGHKYIVCLLNGTQFAAKEDIKKSTKIKDEIDTNEDIDVEEQLNVPHLCTHLFKEELLTNEESHELSHSITSPQKKVRKLLSILDTKGPTAYYIFAYKCLAEEKEHMAHAELFTKLTGENVENYKTPSRKRKASDEDICTTLAKRYPILLESPEGLKDDKYLVEIRNIRRYHLKGREWWEQAEKLKLMIMDSEDFTREMKIAVLLESCTMFITQKNEREVLARVETAEKMCDQLHSEGYNVDMLEARCQWAKAKLYRYTKELNKAEEHIAIARSKLHNCEEGEERALVSYCYACILLAKTSKDENQAFRDLHLAIRCAREGESPHLKQGKYGLDPTHCKLRLAQAYVGSSTGNTGKKLGEVTQENIREATTVLKTIEEKDLQNRQKCMYLYTWSDVLRVGGQLDEAIGHADKAFRLAQKHNFKTEIESAKLRQSALEDQHRFAFAF